MTPATREACAALVVKWRANARFYDRHATEAKGAQEYFTCRARADEFATCARELDAVLAREPVTVADELPAEIGRPAWSEVVDG
jgi:hypothetical protein